MSDEDEEFGWITETPNWNAEEDLRWCANIALGMGGLIVLAGIIFSNYSASTVVKCYTITAALIFGALFFVVGGAIHWHVHQKIKRTTIKRRGEGWGK